MRVFGHTRGADDVVQWADLAEQLLANGPDRTPPNHVDRHIGFPCFALIRST